MSVTFHPVINDTDICGWEISCYEDTHQHRGTYSSYESCAEAYSSMLSEELVTPGSCLIVPVWAACVAEADVNTSGRTARVILEACSLAGPIDEPLHGSCDPTEMLKKLFTSEISTGNGVNTEIVARRKAELIELCNLCIRLGRHIVWS